MQIVAALWIDNVDFRREFEGGPTKIDITGAYFSVSAREFPANLTPHLLVLLRAEDETARSGTLDVAFVREADGTSEGAGEEVGHHRSPVTVQPPGKFFYQLVRPELTFAEPGTIEARCTIPETGSSVVTPLTVVV
jgi:hypothetical protein